MRGRVGVKVQSQAQPTKHGSCVLVLLGHAGADPHPPHTAEVRPPGADPQKGDKQGSAVRPVCGSYEIHTPEAMLGFPGAEEAARQHLRQ